MNHRLMVSDPAIRKQLQLAGLRFMASRAEWLQCEARIIFRQLQHDKITSAQVDARLEELGALDLVYPELMRDA
ncbi:hypothetical protein [Bradyrhizobium australafricanum]|uniref:hypothetical protein n=1 Tax=Bradyrhizobium australafricanum TaxID=2821406 RepID=UPI001CE282BD|nr:hypothetical protein [Bradyrhizobium australafricanum]MCA6102778.1 hypothetical protein [Bradyrhizobium australafricanum]